MQINCDAVFVVSFWLFLFEILTKMATLPFAVIAVPKRNHRVREFYYNFKRLFTFDTKPHHFIAIFRQPQ